MTSFTPEEQVRSASEPPDPPTPDPDDVTAFFNQWSLYRSVIESDSMEHVEVYRAVRARLAIRNEPFTLLDLGCGDAAGIRPALDGTQLARYVGVDRAARALDFAAVVLDGLPAEVELRIGDLMDSVTQSDEAFDVIVAAFALHHFGSQDKQRFLRAARSRLRPGGELVLVDVVRRDGQTREEYLDAYARFVGSWTIPADVKPLVVAHVRGNDFPEEVSVLAHWGRLAGFSEVELLYSGARQTQAAWSLRG